MHDSKGSTVQMSELCTCSYFGADFDLILCDHHRKSLWDLGFYGNKPTDSLVKLTDYEKLYLVKKGLLKRPLLNDSSESFFETVCGNNKVKYKTYEVLRDAGWIVRSGLNYGTDFVLYRSSPDTEHAEYAVVAMNQDGGADTTWRRLLGINRSCVGAKKVGTRPQIVFSSNFLVEIDRVTCKSTDKQPKATGSRTLATRG